jgi:uncharacterized protein (DUF433 family)
MTFCASSVSHMLDWSQRTVLERIPGKMSGAWQFKNARTPVKALFENLEGGADAPARRTLTKDFRRRLSIALR